MKTSLSDRYHEEKYAEVDAIVLSMNRANFTIDCIQSILIQENVSLHIWVIDQGSEKSQLDIIKGFLENKPNVKLIELGKNVGVPGGRNIGMKMGTAEFIICIDNDAEFASKLEIEKAVTSLKESQDIAIVGFKIQNYFTDKLDLSSWAYSRALLDKQNERFLTTRFCGAGHAIKRSSLQETDLYDESLFFYWEEVDLSYQAINLGYKIYYDPQIVVRHKVTDDNKVQWSGKRFYYLVRNFLYLNWKYYRSINLFVIYAGGYLIKGLFNGLFTTTIKGIKDAIKMSRNLKERNSSMLNQAALRYINENDTSLRGGFFRRLKNEVLIKLPKEQ
jgi:GT2 family glycosyltransferase